MVARLLGWEEVVGDSSLACNLVHRYADKKERMMLEVEEHYNRRVNRREHTMMDSWHHMLLLLVLALELLRLELLSRYNRLDCRLVHR